MRGQGAFFATAGRDSQLAEIMSRVNRYLCERLQLRNYATVFYCTVQKDGQMHWINAGHCPPLVVRADGTIELLPASGCPVGLFPAAAFGQEETRLRTGDKLVIYTDGVSEAENPSGQQFGEDRRGPAERRHHAGDPGIPRLIGRLPTGPTPTATPRATGAARRSAAWD